MTSRLGIPSKLSLSALSSMRGLNIHQDTMPTSWLLAVLFLSSVQFARVATYSLTMRPEHVNTSSHAETVSYMCTADSALSGCQYRWWSWVRGASPLLDLSRGSLSQANATHLDTKLTGYSYIGRGLKAGDCGVSLQVEGWKRWMVACRVRAETGGWTYAWADLYAYHHEHLPNTLTPREIVVLPGGEARFTLKAQEPLRGCDFFRRGLELYFHQGAQSDDSTGRHRYLGGGLEGGECGLALSNVSEADNGPFEGYVNNEMDTKDEDRFMVLIVARPPNAPILSVIYTDAAVTAICAVHKGRPVANITWLLGDVVVRQDSLDDRPGHAQDKWRWPWIHRSAQQRLTLGLQAEDNGKVLKCVASHVALDQPLEATEIISFTARTNTTAPLVTTSTASPGTTPDPSPCTCLNATLGTTPDPSPCTCLNATLGTTPDPSPCTCLNATLGTTPDPSPCTCLNATLGTTPDPTCTATSMLGLLCQEYRVRASQLGNTSCPRDEVYEFRVREARAAARAAELAEEQAKVALEAAKAEKDTKAVLAKLAEEQAKVTLEAAKSAARAEVARTRKEEVWAKNAEEELQFGRERRRQSLQQLQSPQSAHVEPTNISAMG